MTALCIDDFVFHRYDFPGRVGVIPQVLNKTLLLFLNARVDSFLRASVCVCAGGGGGVEGGGGGGDGEEEEEEEVEEERLLWQCHEENEKN